jgi:hypothetical protein
MEIDRVPEPILTVTAFTGMLQNPPGFDDVIINLNRQRTCAGGVFGKLQQRYFLSALAATAEPPTIFSQVPFGT